MKAAEHRLPVMVGDYPNPVGFVEVGTIAADGIKLKHPDDGDRRIWAGRRVNLSVRVDFAEFDHTIVGRLLGDPLAALAYQARAINPHWYLDGDQ